MKVHEKIYYVQCLCYFIPPFFFKGNFIFIYFWLRWVFVAARAFPSCGEQGLLFIAPYGLLIAVAFLMVEHRLQTRRLSSCGTRA